MVSKYLNLIYSRVYLRIVYLLYLYLRQTVICRIIAQTIRKQIAHSAENNGKKIRFSNWVRPNQCS
jgi:hypothetical protein